MAKQSKQEANYSRGMLNSHCGKVFPNDHGYCQHFIARKNGEAGTCEVVEGEIQPLYWCKNFKKAGK